MSIFLSAFSLYDLFKKHFEKLSTSHIYQVSRDKINALGFPPLAREVFNPGKKYVMPFLD